MIRQLDLDQEQEKKLRKILEESRQQQKQVERRRFQNVRRIRRQTIREIRSILEPDQVDKLNGFLKRLNRRKSGRRNSPSP